MRNHLWRTLAATAAVGALFAGPLATPSHAAAPPATQTPSFYPSGFDLSTTSYTLQFAGGNRRSTAGTAGITASNNRAAPGGAYPFDQGDKTDTDTAYGFDTCPTTIGIAADDTPADALAASAAFDTQLDGVAVATGGPAADNVNTGKGVLLLTQSARTGATDLSTETLQAIAKIKENCPGFDSMVFGGSTAIPPGAIATLDSVTGTVYQFAGVTREDTARKVARSIVGGSGLPTVTHYPDATGLSTASLTKTVFLAEEQTGADALAAGPVAAEFNIPMLLTNKDSLPTHTADGLAEFSPDNIIVLGGVGAISEPTAVAASNAAGGALLTRIGGLTRAGTSVAIAKELLNLYPEFAEDLLGDANGFYDDQTFGFARSEGSGPGHVGWPDALSSAWWLAMSDDVGTAPQREAVPVEKNGDGDRFLGGDNNGQPPLLLTQHGSLAPEVAEYLSELWPDPDNMRTATNDGGDDGGFGYIFGGDAAISPTQTLDIAHRLSGFTYTTPNRSDLAPTIADGSVFYTNLAYTGYTPGTTAGGPNTNGATGAGDKVCGFRNTFTGTEWLTVYDGADFLDTSFLGYESANQGFTPFQSLFTCVTSTETAVSAIGFGPSGHETSSKDLAWGSATSRLGSGGDLADGTADGADPASGCDVYADLGAGLSCTETWTFTGSAPVTFQDVVHGAATFVLTITVTRTDGADADTNDAITASGTLEVSDGGTLFTATLTGESSTNVSPLKISGFYSQAGALGGFHLTLTGAGATAALSDFEFEGNAA